MPRVSGLSGMWIDSTSDCENSASREAAASKPSAFARSSEGPRPQQITFMPKAAPAFATRLPILP